MTMRNLLYYAGILVIAVLFVAGCEKNDNNNSLILTGKMTGSSDCKFNSKSTSEVLNTPDTLSCVEYSFDSENKVLTLKHINTAFNCCPDSLYCNIEFVGDTILIREHEKAATCRCNCLYDLNYEIKGVESKSYIIKFVEPYAGDQDKLLFEIHLTDTSTGSCCVERTQYPWGMHII
jgi:hypothetical protein